MVIDKSAGITENLGSPKSDALLGGLFAPCASFGLVLKLVNADCGSVTARKSRSSKWVRLLGAERRLAERKCLR
jgi:hypothetical protein